MGLLSHHWWRSANCHAKSNLYVPEIVTSSACPSPQAGEPAAGGRCTRTGSRRAAAALVPPGTDVVAVRISAPGWEDAVLDGLQVLISKSTSFLTCSSSYAQGLW